MVCHEIEIKQPIINLPREEIPGKGCGVGLRKRKYLSQGSIFKLGKYVWIHNCNCGICRFVFCFASTNQDNQVLNRSLQIVMVPRGANYNANQMCVAFNGIPKLSESSMASDG